MNPATAVAFVCAGLFAVGNWIGAARKNQTLVYVCKPATLTALIAAACLLDPAADASSRRTWFVVALVFSLAGDVFLMLPSDLFVAGLAAFLVGHLAYVAGFWTDPPELAALAIATLVVLVIVIPLARRILGALGPAEREFLAPVTAYIVVISAMLASALASGNWVAAVGAALFVWSDSMIAWDRFVRPWAWSSLAIMVTYHLGQGVLVVSLLR